MNSNINFKLIVLYTIYELFEYFFKTNICYSSGESRLGLRDFFLLPALHT